MTMFVQHQLAPTDPPQTRRQKIDAIDRWWGCHICGRLVHQTGKEFDTIREGSTNCEGLMGEVPTPATSRPRPSPGDPK